MEQREGELQQRELYAQKTRGQSAWSEPRKKAGWELDFWFGPLNPFRSCSHVQSSFLEGILQAHTDRFPCLNAFIF